MFIVAKAHILPEVRRGDVALTFAAVVPVDHKVARIACRRPVLLVGEIVREGGDLGVEPLPLAFVILKANLQRRADLQRAERADGPDPGARRWSLRGTGGGRSSG